MAGSGRRRLQDGGRRTQRGGWHVVVVEFPAKARTIGAWRGSSYRVMEIRAGTFAVLSVERDTLRRQPLPPFTTATLQQEAARRLGFGIGEALANGEEVRLPGFATFGTRSRPARNGRNPMLTAEE